MKLFFMRHAIAVLRGTPGFENDSKRPLTPKGEKKMERIALGMKEMQLEFDAILASPYVRARSTAEIAARVMGIQKKLLMVESLAADANPKDLIDYLQKSHKEAQSLLLVGHEPYMSGLISTLLSGTDTISIDLKKGGLCKLTVDELKLGACATLNWLLAPKQLAALG